MIDSPPPLARFRPAALLLDFDGTLVELAESPQAIAVPGPLSALLTRLAARLDGRLAIVSGRPVADLRAHLPGLAVALCGSHGGELRYADGRAVPASVPAGLAAAADEVRAFARAWDGLLVEEKPAGVALHYRSAPAMEGRVLAFLEEIGERTGLALQRGKAVGELRAADTNKGAAVRRLMSEPPFAGTRPVFVGDDLTDEDAFAAAVELGGEAILVGPPRPTAARWRLDDVAATAAWLREAAGHG
jgi:trehalose 6-phosphate phosphatase